jgi:hypothetical protein
MSPEASPAERRTCTGHIVNARVIDTALGMAVGKAEELRAGMIKSKMKWKGNADVSSH